MKLPKLTRMQWAVVAGVLAGIAAGVAYYFYQRNRKRKLAAASVSTGSMASPASSGEAPVIPLAVAPAAPLFSNCPDDSFPLKYGKCGKRVEQFQLYLIKNYGAQFSTYGVDGKWGDETDMLAKRYILKNEPFSISEDYFNKTGMYAYNTIKYA